MAWGRRRSRYDYWPRYVPVAERRAAAAKEVAKLKKKGQEFNPVVIPGRQIANTFWGKAWCNNLESYSDFANRLPRGRTYVRNGSVVDLQVKKGEINALVSGSSIYKVHIAIAPTPEKKWKTIVSTCAGKIDSLIELLQGKFSKSVMETIASKQSGLFPHPEEIKLNCSCPDYATLCKHVAATLYAVGTRLDEKPEELFVLRHSDHHELIQAAETIGKFKPKTSKKALDDTDLSKLFGIEMGEPTKTVSKSKPAVKKTAAKKTPKAKPKTKNTLKSKGKPKSKKTKRAVSKRSTRSSNAAQ